MNIVESELFKKYPRVAPTAHIYGFTSKDIDSLLFKIANDLIASSYFNTNDSRQVALKAILVKLGLNRNEFYKHIEFRKNQIVSDEELEKDCGKYNLKAYKAILK
jgi:hypothetical protein